VKFRILVSLGLGIASMVGCTQGYPKASAPPAVEPTPLIPPAYTEPLAAVAPAASRPAPTMLQSPAGLSPAMILNPYRPYWIVDVH
jgi:hypothetical protein